MKKIILTLITAFALTAVFAETKKVCNIKPDGKKECKNVKIHKKLESTKVEDVKKK